MQFSRSVQEFYANEVAAFAACWLLRLDSFNVPAKQCILGREIFLAAKRLSTYRMLCYTKLSVLYYVHLI